MSDPSRKIVQDRNVRPFVSPQQKKQRRITIVVVLVVAAIGVGAYFLLAPREDSYTLKSYETAVVTAGKLERTTQASGAVTIPSKMEIRSPEAGYAAEIYVSEGDIVTTGQLLARIDVPDLEENYLDLIEDYEKSVLSNMRSVQQNAITNARKQRSLADTESAIAEAEEEKAKFERLVAVNSARQSDLDSAEDKLDDLIHQYDEAALQLAEDILLQDLDQELKLADLDQTKTQIDRLQEQIDSATITSPMDGEVQNVAAALSVPGTAISANQSIIIIADPGSAVADLELLEQYSSAVTAGDIVQLTISNQKMNGEVTQVGRIASASSDGLGATVALRIQPIDPPVALLEGSTAVGTVILGVAENTLMLPRGPYLTTGGQRYVYRLDSSDSAVRVEVTFGQVEGNIIEVISGLAAGDEIILSGYQNFIEYQSVKLDKGE